MVVAAQHLDTSGGSTDVTFEADLLVAADGSNSTIRRIMHPEDKRRSNPALETAIELNLPVQ